MSLRTLVAGAAAVGFAGLAHADVYNDSVGDLFQDASGFAHLDIASVEVSNDATKLYLTLNLAGDAINPDWGKYGVMLDTRGGGTNTPTNPWVRNINSSNLNDFWIGSWVNGGGGAQLWEFDGVNWFEKTATYSGSEISQDLSAAAAGTVAWAIDLATLGLTVGDVVLFDVITTGGTDGDPGVDHLSRLDLATGGWGEASTAGNYLAYTIVPAPGAAALLGFGGLLAARRRRA